MVDDISSDGPDRSYREEITLAELLKLFPNDEAAREWLEVTMWPDGLVWSRCHSGQNARPSGHLTILSGAYGAGATST